MWITVAFISTTVFFVGVTVATLYHQRWSRRLPALETSPPAVGVRSVAGALLGRGGGAE